MTASPGDVVGGAAVSSLGARLRAIREEAHIERPDLARQINLDVKVIIALEQGDFAALPPPLYVKGYIRSIAKQFAADSNELLAAYERERAGIEDPKLIGFSSRPAIQLTSSSLRMRFITAGVALTLLVLVGIWWHTYYYEPARPDTPVVRSDTIKQMSGVATPRTASELLPVEPDATLEGRALPAAAALKGPPDEIPAVAARSATTLVTMAPTLPTAPAAGRPGLVTIETSEETWVGVTDARGERLFFDTARAGQTIAVAGVPPYQLIIGNTRGVKLFFGGEAIDLASYERQGVARFTLGTTKGAQND